MTPGAMHRSPGAYLTAEENSGKPQLGDPVIKTAAGHRLKWGTLPSNYVGRRRKEKGRIEVT